MTKSDLGTTNVSLSLPRCGHPINHQTTEISINAHHRICTGAMNSQSRPFDIPALYPIQSLQSAMSTVAVAGLPSVVSMAPGQPMSTYSVMSQNTLSQPIAATRSLKKPSSPPPPKLYLCRTSNNATGRLPSQIFVLRCWSLLYTLLVREPVRSRLFKYT